MWTQCYLFYNGSDGWVISKDMSAKGAKLLAYIPTPSATEEVQMHVPAWAEEPRNDVVIMSQQHLAFMKVSITTYKFTSTQLTS